jgi:hypothetical protein
MKLFHDSLPPRNLPKRQTTLDGAIFTPRLELTAPGWEMADRMGDEWFQWTLGSAATSVNLSGCWQAVFCVG